MLSQQNYHIRDDDIRFEEKDHKYTILTDTGSKYISVTGWVHSHFEPFDADKVIDKMMASKKWSKSVYFGKTKEEIKEMWSGNGTGVAAEGTKLHHDIETFMNIGGDLPCTHETLLRQYETDPGAIDNHSLEWSYFLEFIRSTPELSPYRSEWVVYNEDIRISGTIDMVYQNPDGTLMIYDWKRCREISPNGWAKFSRTTEISHLPDSNYWHYCLQLNMYKYILEEKYEKKVTKICLVKIHPENKNKSFEIVSLPVLKTEMADLVSLRTTV